MVAGEEEMESGTVDVRTRDTERHGKMRVDELAKHLATLKPAPSPSYNNFYKNAWNPDNYKKSESSNSQISIPSESKPNTEVVQDKIEAVVEESEKSENI